MTPAGIKDHNTRGEGTAKEQGSRHRLKHAPGCLAGMGLDSRKGRTSLRE
eukprot:jgi/Mesvir1/27471/Mv26390-RA.1